MPEGSPLRELVKQAMREVLAETEQVQGRAFNRQGTVVGVNADGTVTVQTPEGTFSNVGTPRQLVKGEQVVVITADGKRVAV